MATYGLGDVQGCFGTLERLLERICFDPGRDRLWSVGDLVNRGPRSTDVLRWARSQGEALSVVLGNHDLHLIALADGALGREHQETLGEILEAPDRDELVAWLRRQPLLHHEGDTLMVHAGLLPSWTAGQAQALASELEGALRAGPEATRDLFRIMYSKLPARWDPALSGPERLAFIASVFTRLRVSTPGGEPDWEFTGPPRRAPAGHLPWFEVPGRRTSDLTVVFGHWAALGLRLAPRVIALDTGCVWGRTLTAVRLEDRALFQEPLADAVV